MRARAPTRLLTLPALSLPRVCARGHFLGAVEIPWSELLERDESKTHHKLLRRERLSEAARAIGPKEGISQSMIQGMRGFKAWVAGRPA